jgi:hypothetical protein
MRTTALAAAWTVTTATMVACAATAHADMDLQLFQSPSRNISCQLYLFQPNVGSAGCEISESTWVVPPRPSNCQGRWGNAVGLVQGRAAALNCHSDTLFGGNPPTLPYGASRTLAAITCDSEPAGITCRDSTTGHFFSVARDSYQLG